MSTKSGAWNFNRLLSAALYSPIWFVAIIGLCLSLTALWLIQQQLEAHKTLEFEWVAHNRIRAINHGIDNGLLAVATVRDFYNAADGMGSLEFEKYAKSQLQRHQGIQALMWIPASNPAGKISAGTTANFWQSAWKVHRSNESLTFDWSRGKKFSQFLNQMLTSEDPTVSGRITFQVGKESSGYGFMAGIPVYSQPQEAHSRIQPHGFVVVLYKLSELVNTSVSLLEPRGVDVLVLDQSAAPEEQFLHYYASRLSPREVASSNYAEWVNRDSEPRVAEKIRVANRDWLIICGQTDLFRSAEAFHEGPWVVLGAGLLFTLLLSVYLAHIKEKERERLSIQQRLVEREELFRQMTETVDEVFWAISGDTNNTLYLSPAYRRIFGDLPISKETQQGLAILSEVPEGDRTRLIQALQQIREEGVATEVIHRVHRNDSSIRWVRTRGFPVHDNNGKISRIVGFLEDITEKKLADEALRDSEAKLRDMFQQSPDIIMTVDEKGKILLMNRSIPELPADRAVGRSSLALMPYDFRKWFRKALKKVIRKGVTREFEYSADNGILWEGRIVPIRADGPVSAAMVIATDVTEKRNLEMQAQHNARLASVGVLAAGVAHEINNPNNAIQFNASLVSRAWKDATPILTEYYQENGSFTLGGLNYSEVRESFPRLLTEISHNSERIRRIVQNLKHMARQDAGGMMRDVDIQQVLEATLLILHNQVQKFTDYCTLEVPDDLPLVKGNSQQLEQVFINVILNALQSLGSRDRGVFISAHFLKTDEVLEIIIKDEGCGISERNIGRLSEPFFTTRQETGGTGLGLSISRSIVERHAGTMEFQSKQNVGTSVTIRIPVQRSVQEIG